MQPVTIGKRHAVRVVAGQGDLGLTGAVAAGRNGTVLSPLSVNCPATSGLSAWTRKRTRVPAGA